MAPNQEVGCSSSPGAGVAETFLIHEIRAATCPWAGFLQHSGNTSWPRHPQHLACPGHTQAPGALLREMSTPSGRKQKWSSIPNQ